MVLEPLDIQILRAIAGHERSQGYPATYRDVALLSGVAVSAVHGRVKVLREGGLVNAKDSISRSISLTAAGRNELTQHANAIA